MQDDQTHDPEMGRPLHLDLSWMDAQQPPEVCTTAVAPQADRCSTETSGQGQEEQAGRTHPEITQLRAECRELRFALDCLSRQSLRDELTGLRNRTRFREELEGAWSFAVRHNLLLSAIVLDVDELRSYNREVSDTAGDRLLQDLARYLDRNLRAYDVLARLEGGEFAVLLPATDQTDAHGIAERLRRGIEGASWPARPVTASFGVATLECSGMTSLEILDRSVQAMRFAKTSGKNQVVHHADLRDGIRVCEPQTNVAVEL